LKPFLRLSVKNYIPSLIKPLFIQDTVTPPRSEQKKNQIPLSGYRVILYYFFFNESMILLTSFFSTRATKTMKATINTTPKTWFIITLGE